MYSKTCFTRSRASFTSQDRTNGENFHIGNIALTCNRLSWSIRTRIFAPRSVLPFVVRVSLWSNFWQSPRYGTFKKSNIVIPVYVFQGLYLYLTSGPWFMTHKRIPSCRPISTNIRQIETLLQTSPGYTFHAISGLNRYPCHGEFRMYFLFTADATSEIQRRSLPWKHTRRYPRMLKLRTRYLTTVSPHLDVIKNLVGCN